MIFISDIKFLILSDKNLKKFDSSEFKIKRNFYGIEIKSHGTFELLKKYRTKRDHILIHKMWTKKDINGLYNPKYIKLGYLIYKKNIINLFKWRMIGISNS